MPAIAPTFVHGWLLRLVFPQSHISPILSFRWLSTPNRLILYFTSHLLFTCLYNLHTLSLFLSTSARTLTKTCSFLHSLEMLAASKCHTSLVVFLPSVHLEKNNVLFVYSFMSNQLIAIDELMAPIHVILYQISSNN